MPRFRPFLALVLGGLASCSPGQQADSTGAEQALAEIATAAVEHGYPGIVLAGSVANGPVVSAAAGLADRAQRTPMTGSAMLHGGSTTKAFTAMAVLALVDAERLRLDAAVTDLLPPELCDGIPHIDRVQVRQLLTHESGIYCPHDDPRFFAKYGHQFGPEGQDLGFRRASDIARDLAVPANLPEFEPGAGENYNGLNYVLLELIVEAVAKRSLPEVVQEKILDPLELRSTFYLSTNRRRPRARGYTIDSPRIRRMGLHSSLVADADGYVDTTDYQDESNGGAGIVASMPDLVRFARAMVNGTLLGKDSTSLMLGCLEETRDGSRGMKLGVLRAMNMPNGPVVLALGNGLGTHVVWAYHPASSAIIAIGVNQFGAFDEAGYFMSTLIPGALAAVAR